VLWHFLSELWCRYFWGEGGAEKRILVGAGEEGKETDKRINERKLMTNDRLSWIRQSLKSQISNFKFFLILFVEAFIAT